MSRGSRPRTNRAATEGLGCLFQRRLRRRQLPPKEYCHSTGSIIRLRLVQPRPRGIRAMLRVHPFNDRHAVPQDAGDLPHCDTPRAGHLRVAAVWRQTCGLTSGTPAGPRRSFGAFHGEQLELTTTCSCVPCGLAEGPQQRVRDRYAGTPLSGLPSVGHIVSGITLRLEIDPVPRQLKDRGDAGGVSRANHTKRSAVPSSWYRLLAARPPQRPASEFHRFGANGRSAGSLSGGISKTGRSGWPDDLLLRLCAPVETGLRD